VTVSTRTSTGTFYGGTGGTSTSASLKGGHHGPSASLSTSTTGSVIGGTKTSSRTEGSASAGGSAFSGTGVCAGPGCTNPVAGL